MIELFESCVMEVCDTYHVNANIIEKIENTLSTIQIEKKSEENNKENMTKFPGIVSLMQLQSYSLHLVLQEGKNYFSRVAAYSVFAKIFDPATQKFSFKAYYCDPEYKEPENSFIQKEKSEVIISERSLESYEALDFKLGIKKLKKLQRDVLKLFISKDFSWIPLDLSRIIIDYVVYEIPFKLIGQVTRQISGMEFLPRDVNSRVTPFDQELRSRLELFSGMGMKTQEVYKKYGLLFYYCESLELIHCWTKKKLEKSVYLSHQSPYVRTIPVGGQTKNLLQFISESSRKKSKRGHVFQYREDGHKIHSLSGSLIHNFKIN